MSTTPHGGSIQAVEFALEILEYVARCQTSVGVSEMARAFDTTKSRIHRHLQTLVSAGYLIRNEDTERYSISARLMALGQAVSESFELATAAIFDLGVFLCVLGAVLLALASLSRLALRTGEGPNLTSHDLEETR